MFIFGRKKKEKSLYEIYQELAEKHGVPVELIRAIGGAHLAYDGYVELMKRIDPEGDLEKIKKSLT